MKSILKVYYLRQRSVFWFTLSLFLASLVTLPAQNSLWASEAPSSLPSSLEEALGKDVSRQPVEPLDRRGLRLIFNERFEDVKIEGWNTKALTPAEAELLFSQYGVRTVWESNKEHPYFLTPSNVGRAGILEGDIYFKLNGKIFRGLTLKGYGGNEAHPMSSQFGAQPSGSLDLSESIRDMEMSTILAENKVDTYLGVLIVERPGKKANYVRLSRTALRMEDLIRIKGNKLSALVDHLTDLLKEEMGKKLTPVEFSRWLIQSTSDLMARKDYLRFRHAAVTRSNLGIGEIVDLGDEKGVSGKGALMLPDQYNLGEQNPEFKGVLEQAHKNLSKLDPEIKNIPFDELYDSNYKTRFESLQLIDQAKINLNRASVVELTSIGFNPDEAKEIVKYNLGVSDGILDPAEITSLKSITRDVKAILERATTDFLKLSDGTTLSEYYVRNVGGAEGVRELMEETRKLMKEEGYRLERGVNGEITGNVREVEASIRKLALEQAKKRGFLRAITANRVTNFSSFIAKQALEVIARR